MSKKFLSVFLALVMIITTISTSSILAFAEIFNVDGEDEVFSTNIDNIDGDDEEIQDDIDSFKFAVSKYDPSTVNADDLADIEKIKNDLNKFSTNCNDVLTDTQKEQLNATLSDIAKLENAISSSDKAVKDAVAKADSIKSVDASNVDSAKNIVADIDSLINSTNLTDAQKAELKGKRDALQKAIDAYQNAPAPTEPAKPSDPDVKPSTPVAEPSQPTAPVVSDVENSKDAFALNAGLKVTNSGKSIGVKWGKVSEADGYLVYVQYCGKNFSKNATKTISSGKTTSCTISKINGKAISKTKNFKVYVVAYKNFNGEKIVLGKTITAHVVGAKNKTYTNVKSLSVSNKKINLKKGKTATIKAKTTLVDKKKKPLTNSHAKQFRYKSTNNKVATVTSKGKIKAVGKGKCTIYVYARNGYAKAITVTVK